MIAIDDLKFDEKGLIPAIVQDADSGRVLTLAYMNRESLGISLERRLTCFWSRSRQELWLKGETSGNYQHIVSIMTPCWSGSTRTGLPAIWAPHPALKTRCSSARRPSRWTACMHCSPTEKRSFPRARIPAISSRRGSTRSSKRSGKSAPRSSSPARAANGRKPCTRSLTWPIT